MGHRIVIHVRQRIVIQLCAVIALFLLVEGLASYHIEDQLTLSAYGRMVSVVFGGGAVDFAEFGFPNPRGLGLRFHREHHPMLDVNSSMFQHASCLGFAYVGSVEKSAYEYYIVRIPIWFLLLLLAPICALAIHKHRVAMRDKLIARLCVKCGYDIRASPDRCPECGTEVKPLPRGLVATLQSM